MVKSAKVSLTVKADGSRNVVCFNSKIACVFTGLSIDS